MGAVCPTAPDSGSGVPDGSGRLPVKPAKLDATALHDDTLANSVPPSEASSHAVLACSPGIPEEHYVSEAVEDAAGCRGYRDACTITASVCVSALRFALFFLLFFSCVHREQACDPTVPPVLMASFGSGVHP
ncbi:hypothetical protein J1605_008590 [Eschrichtius robustus]|uniref:Uncharacterized protein n=1 Tax=Eschrichtius robustus TaxID=9764 RepID=A0AB34GZM2_ESCRO|nr:hypothetical protein J1605_008590 [Eschrichtius robustus]